MAAAGEALLQLVGRFLHVTEQDRRRRNATDFSDFEHLALRLLLRRGRR